VHGIWSSAKAAYFTPGSGGFNDWLRARYPHPFIRAADYGPTSHLSFASNENQGVIEDSIRSLLVEANQSGMAARKVDIVAHSMGGLAAKYFQSHFPKISFLPKSPIHGLVTIGTPHFGSPLATSLSLAAGNTAIGGSVMEFYCGLSGIVPCDLSGVLGKLGKKVDSGVESLCQNSADLNAIGAVEFYPIAASAPQASGTEGLLNFLIFDFLRGTSVGALLGDVPPGSSLHDTIVPVSSQLGGFQGLTIVNTVHTDVYPADTGETESEAAWAKAYKALVGQSPPLSASSSYELKVNVAPAPIIDLGGYSHVDATGLAVMPPNLSILPVGIATNVAVTSSIKTITQLTLMQTVNRPQDPPFQFASAAPFEIAITPDRVGQADFVVLVLFSDFTYTMVPVTYTYSAVETPLTLELDGVPIGKLQPGMTAQLGVRALFSTGWADVTSASTFLARKENGAVVQVDSSGSVRAIGYGSDWVDVQYSGLTSSASFFVGVPIQALDPMGDMDDDGIPNAIEVVEDRDPFDKDNEIFAASADGARWFGMQQYRDFLAREGEAPGINFWAGQINAGALSRGQVIESFFSSPEFQETIAPVARLYFAYFLRIPDYDGLNYWIRYYRAGMSLSAISDLFAQSVEFRSMYGSLDNAAFVSLLYQNVLGRAPDAFGLTFWKGELDAGTLTRGQVMLGFSESREYKAFVANEVYVTMTYVGMLRRAPDADGFRFWVGYRDSGNSGLALIDGFLSSAEYRGRFLP